MAATRLPRTEELLDKAPPGDDQAEAAVLACIFLDPRLLGTVSLSEVDFRTDHCRKIYSAMLSCRTQGKPIDSILILPELVTTFGGTTSEWTANLYEVIQSQPTPTNYSFYAKRITELSARRRFIRLGAELIQNGHNSKPVAEILETATENLRAIGAGGAEQAHRIQYMLLSAAELDSGRFDLEYLIPGLLVRGQPALIVGAQKSMKTTLLVALLLSLATGQPFLGHFPVKRKCRVLLMSGESGLATLQETARRIAQEMGLWLSEVDGFFLSPDVPKVGQAVHAQAFKDILDATQPDCIAIDPAYLSLPGSDAGNLFIQGEMLSQLNAIAKERNATFILAHHTRKNGKADPFGPCELQDASWSGFAEWARQWLLLSRRERYEPGSGSHRLWLSIGGSAGHSGLYGLDIDEGIYDASSQRIWKVEVRTPDEARSSSKDQRSDTKQRELEERSTHDRKLVVAAMRKFPEGETKTVLRDHTALNSLRFDAALAGLLEDQIAEVCEILKSNQKTPKTAYRLVPEVEI